MNWIVDLVVSVGAVCFLGFILNIAVNEINAWNERDNEIRKIRAERNKLIDSL